MPFSFDVKNILSKFTQAAAGTSNRTVGVDFGSSAIKLVELEHSDAKPKLTTYGELQLGPYGDLPVGDIPQLPKEKQKEALVDIFREAGVQTRAGAFSIPLQASFVTSVQLSIGENETLDSRARVEARKYIPVPMTDVSLDWADITHEHTPEGKTEILLVAIQNRVVLEYQSLMESINMLSQPTEIECFSAIRALDESDQPYTLVIDIGARTTKLYISQNGLLQRMHRVRTGGETVTKRLSSLYEVSFTEAEAMKRRLRGQDKIDTDVRNTIASVFERPLHEFGQVIEQYRRDVDASFDHIILTGSTAQLPTLPAVIQEGLQLPVQIAQPFEYVEYPPFMSDTLRDIGPSFTVALGAAFRTDT